MANRKFGTSIILIVSVVFMLGVDLVAMPQAQARNKNSQLTKPQSRESLVLKCRKAVFRKYGYKRYHLGKRVRSLPMAFAVRQIDDCVASGGRAK